MIIVNKQGTGLDSQIRKSHVGLEGYGVARHIILSLHCQGIPKVLYAWYRKYEIHHLSNLGQQIHTLPHPTVEVWIGHSCKDIKGIWQILITVSTTTLGRQPWNKGI